MDPLTISGLFTLGENLIDRFFPDENARAEQMIRLKEIEQKGDLAELQAFVIGLQGNLAINTESAKHKSIFVAGARPFVMWICAVGLAYASILEPLMRFIASMNGYVGEFPELDTTITMQLLSGMLGLGVMRSFDKKNGVETNTIGKSR